MIDLQNNQQPTVSPSNSSRPTRQVAVLSGAVIILALAVAYLLFTRPAVAPTDGETQLPISSNGQVTDNKTTDWQTYRNEEYGFEVKYPSDWKVDEDNQAEFATIVLNGNTLHIGVSNQFVKEADVCDSNYSKKPIVNIGSQQNNWCFDGNPDDRWATFINSSMSGVVFYCWFPETQGNLPICNQILSTFKFTGQDETADEDQAFTWSSELGFYGSLELTGYLDIIDRSCDPWNPDDGEICKYAFFRFIDTNNTAIYDFVGDYNGNSFVSNNTIGLGCYEQNPDKIVSVNDGDKGMASNLITGQPLDRLLSATDQNPVKLSLTKPIFTSGRGAPLCYSHFRNFEVK